MIGNFPYCMPLLLDVEKGYWDDPAGGPTNLGVTLQAWEAWIGKPATADDIKLLTPEMVTPFYKEGYWDTVRGDALPAGLDWFTFDCAVNQGPGRARRWLQLSANILPDGVIGNKTLAAISVQPTQNVIARFYNRRWLAYRQDPHFEDDGDGWLNRLDKVRGQALAMIPGQGAAA